MDRRQNYTILTWVNVMFSMALLQQKDGAPVRFFEQITLNTINK